MGVQTSSTVVYPAWTGPTLLWTPNVNLGANLKAWFSADKNLTLAGSRVSTIIDRVAGYTLSQATVADQPLFVASAANGKPGFVNDSYATTHVSEDLSSTAPIAPLQFEYTQPFSMSFAFVYGAGTRQQFQVLFQHTDPTNTYRGFTVELGSTNTSGLPNQIANTLLCRIQHTALTAAIACGGSTALVAGHTYTATITYDGSGVAAGVKFYLNGAAEIGGHVSTDTLGAQTMIGSGQKFTILGDVGGTAGNQNTSPDTFLECFISSGVLASADITGADQYLNNKYAAH